MPNDIAFTILQRNTIQQDIVGQCAEKIKCSNSKLNITNHIGNHLFLCLRSVLDQPQIKYMYLRVTHEQRI